MSSAGDGTVVVFGDGCLLEGNHVLRGAGKSPPEGFLEKSEDAAPRIAPSFGS